MRRRPHSIDKEPTEGTCGILHIDSQSRYLLEQDYFVTPLSTGDYCGIHGKQDVAPFFVDLRLRSRAYVHGHHGSDLGPS